MTELKSLLPEVEILPLVPDLDLFLAVLARAKVFVSGDTGPLHFAAGLGVPTISLFGPSDPALWRPLGPRVRTLRSASLATLPPEAVLAELMTLLGASPPPSVD